MSASLGWQCVTSPNGFNGCSATYNYTFNENGEIVMSANCSVTPYGFCYTLTQ